MAGHEGARLVEIVAQLRREVDGSATEAAPVAPTGPAARTTAAAEPEALVAALREELARLAEATSGAAKSVQPALDGAEAVMRRELAATGVAGLASHLPSFAFLVALPGLGRERALALSARAVELLEAS